MESYKQHAASVKAKVALQMEHQVVQAAKRSLVQTHNWLVGSNPRVYV